MCVNSVFAKRIAPKEVPPLIHEGVEYRVIHWGHVSGYDQNGGYIEVIDSETEKKIWEIKVYTIEYNSSFEKDAQDIFITEIKIEDNNLIVWNEVRDKFVIDLMTKEVKPKNKIYKKKRTY